VVAVPSTLDGSSAFDVLRGDAGADTLRGGGGADRLTGGPGRDRLDGGDGDDLLVDGDGSRPARDSYAGGPGVDGISYAGRARGVRIDLGTRRGGSRGERDRLAGVENATGGNGRDALIGNADPNVLDGGPGADRLAGGDGPDALTGGPGADRLDGGPGDDFLDSSEPSARAATDTVACAGGHDDVIGPAGFDVLERCERVRTVVAGTAATEADVSPRPVAASRRALTFRLRCASAPPSGACRGTLRLWGGRPLRPFGGRGYDVPVRPGSARGLRVALTGAGRRALRSRRPVLVRVAVRAASWAVRL
jgi:RTX calcium-binding nonapeptide repeat (4 copies)